MGYLYENTTPERFQQFCQSLLLPEYPGLQCFPVGQRDGGRDAWHADSHTVLQIKFRRSDEEESADWMIAALEGELPKILRLVANGARRYVMVTNARGTAHLERGRIDRVQAWLDENVPCAAICLWRDDLDQRLASAPATLKFKYTELLTGDDGIELALAQVLGPQRERQLRAVRAFAAKQFSKDERVKFRQVNLSNTLADLFIDVPIRISDNLVQQLRRINRLDAEPASNRIMAELSPVWSSVFDRSLGSAHHPYPSSKIGVAAFLLGSTAQQHLTRVVLEGAPGQGKSTLAQFVCQAHRAVLLDRPDFFDKLPATYSNLSFRLPIKIDLRDLAVFISGTADQPRPRSLDEFISELISRDSGGQQFGVDDFLDVVTSVPTLLFMDGLDEVADLDQRRALVEVVDDALARFEAMGVDLQVVVTSRPSIFGQRANFDRSGFVTVDLADITKRLAVTYAQKWVRARALEQEEADEVLSILGDKMELPHIVDLTRNPMQLTILLSLIHQIGYSLPDQRTDLYRKYLELFFTREAEKTPNVKKHSAVLQSFIQHLAWQLQSQAESAGTRGSISRHDLQEMARKYLREAKESESLADDLFGGGLERIFVLVERVSGLYEFEVQPLREFFCARHLYETSPVGTYRHQTPRGDRAQRFEALAQNPFWLNVTRFYAGSYEPGEIGSLVLSLKEMIQSSSPATAMHGRRVAFALLSDWVFANKKIWQDELIELAFDSDGLDLLIHQVQSTGETFVLDEDCGRDTLRRLLFDQMARLSFGSAANEYCSLLMVNGGNELSEHFLTIAAAAAGVARTDVLVRMIRSGAADSLPIRRILDLVTEDRPALHDLSERLRVVVERFSSKITADQHSLQTICRYALDGRIIGGVHAFDTTALFVDALSAYPRGSLGMVDRHDDPRLLVNQGVYAQYATPAACLPEFVKTVLNGLPSVRDQREPQFNLESDRVVSDVAREFFGGHSWAEYVIALRSVGAPSSEGVQSASRLFDTTVSPYVRARYARLKRGSSRWWLDQLAEAGDHTERRMFWAVLVLAWTSPGVFNALREQLEATVDALTPGDALRLLEALRVTTRNQAPRADRQGVVVRELEDSSERFMQAAILGFRMSRADLPASIRQLEPPFLAAWTEREKLEQKLQDEPAPGAKDSTILDWLRTLVTIQRSGSAYPYSAYERSRDAALVSPRLARKILLSPQSFPRDTTSIARNVVMSEYNPETLTTLAARQDWMFG